jgi:calcineurin-like phosphoesterase family protein
MAVIMTVWFTADLHFGHANIIEYSRRPFRDVVAMDKALVTRWNETVAPDDTVWVLGDVALGQIELSLAHVARLAGRKRLLAGNHDRCWAGHGRRAEGWAEQYLQAGFDEIHHGEVVLSLEGTQVLACHFPYRGDSHDLDRYVAARPVDHGLWLLHGHVHERWRQRGRMLNVGVDAWDYRPVSAATLAEIVNQPGSEALP